MSSRVVVSELPGADPIGRPDIRPHPRARRSSAARLGWGILALCFSIATLEVASRIVLSHPAVLARIRGTSDTAWRLDWLDRHDDGPEIYYSFDVYHPTRGWALQPGVRDADPFGPASLNSNSIGLRGRTEYSEVPPAGTTRIVLLGDSFTFGEEVSDAETFAWRLGSLLPHSEVLNLGVHGYGHDQMLLYFHAVGRRFHPDLVIVGFVRDDMERNLLEFRDYAKPRFEPSAGGLELHNVPVPAPAEILAADRFHSRFLDLLDMAGAAVASTPGRMERRMDAVTNSILDVIAAESAAAGAVTVLAYLPHSEELADPTLTLHGEEFFSDYCQRRAAFCLNLRPLFLQRMSEGLEIKVPGHWHGAGHALVAEGLVDYLVDRSLVTP